MQCILGFHGRTGNPVDFCDDLIKRLETEDLLLTTFIEEVGGEGTDTSVTVKSYMMSVLMKISGKQVG